MDRFKVFIKTDLQKNKGLYLINGYGDKYEKEFDAPLHDVINILENSNNEKIKWNYKKLDIDNHGLIWLGVYNGLLNWTKIKN